MAENEARFFTSAHGSRSLILSEVLSVRAGNLPKKRSQHKSSSLWDDQG